MSRRVKIKPIYATNLFYEKVLTDWKSNSSDTKGAYTIKKALDNLKIYPLVLDGYTDLRKIRGIGEDIANRLNAAAERFRSKEGELTLEKVRSLKRGESLVYLREAVVSKGKKTVPFLTKDEFKSYTLSKIDESAVCLNISLSQPILPTFGEKYDIPCSSISQAVSSHPKPIRSVIEKFTYSSELLEYDPVLNQSVELVLIVDGREDKKSSSGRKSIGEHLIKRGIIHEMRQLAVGDYLWILKLGVGCENEMVMDFVVERKTWDDLKSSIRHSRYAEQKQRLCQSGIKNVIVVAEGSNKNVDRSLEQALTSTSLENGFLIQETSNLAETASFLDSITKHLKQRLKTEKIKGHSFAWLQNESLKTKEISVSDCFLRQLTVCPQMSTNKAADIVRLFPTLRSLRNLYKNCDSSIPLENVLNTHVPSIPPSVSAQIAKFFKSEYASNKIFN